MKTLAVLLGLLLVTLSYSQENCLKEQNKTFYYIYNASVEVQIYSYNFFKDGEVKCKEVYEGKILKDFPGNGYCTYILESLDHFRSIGPPTLCEFPAQANLLEDTISIPDHGPCKYKNEYCTSTHFFPCAFWRYNKVCSNLPQIYKGNFHVWTGPQVKFIENDQMSLQLMEKIQFCESDMWKTNYEGILVSKRNLNMAVRGNYSHYQSDLHQICTTENHLPQKRPKMSTLQYIYKYPVKVTVHFCMKDNEESCEVTGQGKTMLEGNSPLLNLCRGFFCDSVDCRNEEIAIKLCNMELTVNSENDTVTGLPVSCKYSDGLCKSSKAMWFPSSRCANHKKIEAYEEQCGNKTCLVQTDGSTKFSLERQGQLCGENVWYTDQQGIVVSERQLQPKPSNGVLQEKGLKNSSRTNWKSDLRSSKILEYEDYFLGIPLAIGILWVLLKIGVCFGYLCNKLKKKPDN